MYYIFDTYEKAETALQKIDNAMGFPDQNGTETWANIQKAYEQDLWFFLVQPKSCNVSIKYSEIRQNINDLLPPAKEWHVQSKK
jgi:hypothetical protein